MIRPLLVSLLLAATATAQEAERCPPVDVALDPQRKLRALSLDLRGAPPSPGELAALGDAGDPEAALEDFVDAWLDTDAFAAQVVRRHRALLWNNLANLSLLAVNSGLTREGAVYYRRNLARMYRGAIVPCLDEPARFGADGRILTREVDGARREGRVDVPPYWDPSSTLRVCAFDAQANEVSPNGADCGTLAGHADAACGCGPDLRWCFTGASHRPVVEALGESLDRLVFALVREDRPYTELFETRRELVNGPLTYFLRHQTGVPRGFAFEPAPLDVRRLPDLAFTDRDRWVEIALPAEHAGLLTRPAWLLRFQTNRARANRFYDAFLCSPFQPPDGGLPVADEASALDPDLQARAGCKYCHALLEPAAAHWGRWAEQGFAWLDPARFPPQREDCRLCALRGSACSAECRDFYLTRALSEAEEPYLGMLRAYEFRREDHVRHVERGPRLLAFTAVADGRLPACTARRAAEWLLGREMTAEGDAAWLGGLARGFVANAYSYRWLVRSIVTDARYRRVR
jgi:hypothetical protein